jgi:hypothetical protein
LTLLTWWVESSSRFKSRQSFFQQLILLNRIYNLCVAPIDLTCHETFFSNSLQMDTHLFIVQDTSFQILYKWVPIYILCSRIFFSNSIQIDTHFYFFLRSLWNYKLQIQLKYVQSSIKPTQVWNSIKNFFLWTNPLSTNPTNSNQLSLKLWLEINRAL